MTKKRLSEIVRQVTALYLAALEQVGSDISRPATADEKARAAVLMEAYLAGTSGPLPVRKK